MSLTSRDELIQRLQDPEYRHGFDEAQVDEGLAFQIRTLRQARGWSQADLAGRLGTTQSVVSRLEDPDYGRISLSKLKQLAEVFDVALSVRFVPFSEMVQWAIGFSAAALAPPCFEKDLRLTVSVVDPQPARSLFAAGGRGGASEGLDVSRFGAALKAVV